MVASAPTVVMTATATTHVAVPMYMATMNKNDRIIGITSQRVCCCPGRRRGGPMSSPTVQHYAALIGTRACPILAPA